MLPSVHCVLHPKTQFLPSRTPETMTVCLYFTYIKFIKKWTAESYFSYSNSFDETAHCNNAVSLRVTGSCLD